VLVEVLLVAHLILLVAVLAVAVQETMLTLAQEQQAKEITVALALVLLAAVAVAARVLLVLIRFQPVVITAAMAALGLCLLLQAHHFNTLVVAVEVRQRLMLDPALVLRVAATVELQILLTDIYHTLITTVFQEL
jgi:hypothetical protein